MAYAVIYRLDLHQISDFYLNYSFFFWKFRGREGYYVHFEGGGRGYYVHGIKFNVHTSISKYFSNIEIGVEGDSMFIGGV